jgi:hypothetical protein
MTNVIPDRPRRGAGHIIPSLDAPREEVLQFIYDRLKEQGAYSANEFGSCHYRADKTAGCPVRCAIGWLIPDEEYKIGFEGSTASYLCHLIDLPQSVLEDVQEIQREHDGSRNEDISFSVFLDNFKHQFLNNQE